MTSEKVEIVPAETAELAPRTVRNTVRPIVVEVAKKAPELADELIGLLRAVRKFVESKTEGNQ